MTSLAVALVIMLSLPGIPRHPDLDSYAAGHSQWMAANQTLQHSNLYNLPGDWEKAGENIGYGPDLETVIAAMWQSPTHAANFTSDWTHMGVGTARDASGILWVTVVFAKAFIPRAPPPQPKVVPQPSPKPPARVWEPPEACGDNLMRICYL
jgi:hypothetical protein